MYFCNDLDLLVWEPGIFGETDFGHQMLLRQSAGTLTGNTLAMSSAVLGDLLPGMVGQIVLADNSLSQLLEIVSITDTSHAVVSGLRGRADGDLVAPLVGGSVNVSVMTFQAQIAAVGDDLLDLVGAQSDRDTAPTETLADLRGFRTAAAIGTLAAVFRALSTDTGVSTAMLAKRDFYQNAYQTLRRRIQARINGAARIAAVGELVRQ